MFGNPHLFDFDILFRFYSTQLYYCFLSWCNQFDAGKGYCRLPSSRPTGNRKNDVSGVNKLAMQTYLRHPM